MTENNAMTILQYGQELSMKTTTMGPLKRGYARVRIKANGVCATDVKLVDGVGFKPALPFVPGHEPSGIVEEVVTDDPRYSDYPGRSFVVSPHITCGECENCLSGKENICLNMGGSLGISINGAFAQYVDIPLRNLVEMPDGMDHSMAALAGGVVAVPLVAIRGLGDLMEKNVVVMGSGGLAMAAIQILNNIGARVTVIGRKDEKLKVARELGASLTINSTSSDYVKEIMDHTGGRGVDNVVDLAGDPKEVPKLLSTLKRGGTLSIVGYSSSQIVLDYRKIALDAIQIKGSRSYTRRDIRLAVNLMASGKVMPIISHKVPLESANDAISLVRNGTSIGRVVLEI